MLGWLKTTFAVPYNSHASFARAQINDDLTAHLHQLFGAIEMLTF